MSDIDDGDLANFVKEQNAKEIDDAKNCGEGNEEMKFSDDSK